MKEQDYINVTELMNVRVANNCLRDICVANSKAIDKDEYVEVVKTITKWQTQLFSLIDTNKK